MFPEFFFAYFMKYSEEKKISVLFTIYLNDIYQHWTCYKSFKRHPRGLSGKGFDAAIAHFQRAKGIYLQQRSSSDTIKSP